MTYQYNQFRDLIIKSIILLEQTNQFIKNINKKCCFYYRKYFIYSKINKTNLDCKYKKVQKEKTFANNNFYFKVKNFYKLYKLFYFRTYKQQLILIFNKLNNKNIK